MSATTTQPTLDVAALAEANSDRIYRHALRLTKNVADAEDVVQATWLKVLLNASSFRGDSEPMGWIYRITSNEARNLFRKRKRRAAASLETLRSGSDDENATFEIEDEAPGPDQQAVSTERQLGVRHAISRLVPGQRAALELADMGEMHYRDAATALGVTPAVFKTRRHRARRALATRLGGEQSLAAA